MKSLESLNDELVIVNPFEIVKAQLKLLFSYYINLLSVYEDDNVLIEPHYLPTIHLLFPSPVYSVDGRVLNEASAHRGCLFDNAVNIEVIYAGTTFTITPITPKDFDDLAFGCLVDKVPTEGWIIKSKETREIHSALLGGQIVSSFPYTGYGCGRLCLVLDKDEVYNDITFDFGRVRTYHPSGYCVVLGTTFYGKRFKYYLMVENIKGSCKDLEKELFKESKLFQIDKVIVTRLRQNSDDYVVVREIVD